MKSKTGKTKSYVSDDWKRGFEEGIIWAVAEIVRQHKDTVIAKDIFKASGIDLKDYKVDMQDKIQLKKMGVL